MKKLLLLATLIIAPFYATALDVSANLSYGSDYLWRGVSQKGSSALSAGVELEHNGWYSGAWASQVDYGDNSDYEWDVYTGYSHDINDELSIDVGVIQYNFNNEPGNKLEEWYAGGSFRGFSAYYWADLDNSDNHFAEYSYEIPVEAVSISVFYQDPIDFYGINIGKDFGPVTIAGTWGQGRDHDMKDEFVIGLTYNL